MTGPLVSIGMPIYNNEDTILRTVEQFRSQRYDNLEIILSDDCSSDRTGEICRELALQDSRIRYIRQKRNIGSIANHKLVFDLSQGEYFMWCNGHDFVDTNYLSCCVESLEANPALVLCGGKTQRFDSDGNLKELLYSGLDTAGLGVVQRFEAVFRAILKDAILIYGMFRSETLRRTGLHRKTLGGDLILLSEMSLYGDVLQREDTTFYRQIRNLSAEQARDRWVDYIVQPKGFRLEAVSPWLDMAHEYLLMIVDAPHPAAVQEALLVTARDLLRQNFGNSLGKEVEKLVATSGEAPAGALLGDLHAAELLARLNKARTFLGMSSGKMAAFLQGGTAVAGSDFPAPGKVADQLHQASECRPGPVPAVPAASAAAPLQPAQDGAGITHPIDYSKGHIQRTPDHAPRVREPYRPMSLVVDLTKGKPMTHSRNAAAPFSAPSPAEATPVRISFVMIVLNGMPFVEYALRAIYEEAHEIIVVEGAVESCMFAARPDGSSLDGTVECVRNFPDPQGKLRLIQGRWTEKVHMQNKALEYATGNYVWLVDSDEIYKRQDLRQIKSLLEKDPSITQVNFIPDNFWKGFDTIFLSTAFFEKDAHYRRLFKFVPGARFTSHRPPTLFWPGSAVSTEGMHLIGGQVTRGMGIIIYHYSYVLEEQVQQKIELYRRYGWGDAWNIDMNEWFQECFLKWTPANRSAIESQYPVWTGDRKSRTLAFQGSHPEVMAPYIEEFNRPRPTPPSEEEVLSVIGAARYQSMVLDAWRHIELDAPLLERRDTIEAHLRNGEKFWNNHVALAFLADRLQPASYLEVGVRTGGSMVQVLGGAQPARVVAMDLWAGVYSDLPNNVEFTRSQLQGFLEKSGKKSEIQFRQINSHLGLKELIREGRRFDLITIDGDHGYQGAREDLEDAFQLLGERGAVVFDDIIHLAHPFLLDLVHHILADYPNLRAVMNTTQDNGCAIFLKGISPEELLAAQPAKTKRIKIAGECAPSEDLTKVGTESDFARSIGEVFQSLRPRRIIETGTYHGEGTTKVIASTLKSLGLSDALFFSIECNPVNFAQARVNLHNSGLLPMVQVLNGLSTPRRELPSYQEIESRYVRDLDSIDADDIYIDHQEKDRALLYYKETDFSGIPDDLLGACLKRFDYRPDFVLLDSGGHMGNIEFNYLIDQLQGECFIALDDIFHIKHHQSYRQMQKDPRFQMIVSSREKFGFCIARFTPDAPPAQASPQRILWVRADSIGDSILACSMLPHLKERYPGAQITVLCQQQVAELYQASPFVHEVIGFDRRTAYQDQSYRKGILARIQELRADLVLNTVYSREPLGDFWATNSKGRERVAFHGDLGNITEAERDANNADYTRILHSAGVKPELERHRDFLAGLGCQAPQLTPVVWTTPEDEQFAEQLFARKGLTPGSCVALFAGAQYGYRTYSHYGKALNELCREQGLTLIALGTADERELNQQNLDDCGAGSVNLSGELTLRQCAAVLKRCRLAVGAETGTAHMACAVGTPNVVLLGGGHFGRFMPYSPLTSVVCLPLECYGCNWKCRYSRSHCVKDVNPLVIAEAARQTLLNRSDKVRVFAESSTLWLPLQAEPHWKDYTRLLGNCATEIAHISCALPTSASEPGGNVAACA